MEKYTKQQLIDALCEAQEYTPEQGTKIQFVQQFIATQNDWRERQIANIPTGTEEAKRIAIDHLLAQVRTNNADVTL